MTTLHPEDFMGTINGTEASETLVGTNGDDTINGFDGNDVIDGLAGNDVLNGGELQDTLYGGLGNDQLNAGDGGGYLVGEGGNDTLIGGSGLDYIYDGAGDDTAMGGGGDDVIWSLDYTDRAGNGVRSTGSDILDGEGGNDIVYVQRNVLYGTSSDHVTLRGGLGDDTLTVQSYGGTFSYVMEGGAGSDTFKLEAFSGNPTITVDGGDDADTVLIEQLVGSASITLGGGSDSLRLGNRHSDTYRNASITVTDFQTGAGGDRVFTQVFLTYAALGYDKNYNPFGAGYLRLVQSGADTLLQFDRDGRSGPDTFVTLITFKNTDATQFSENITDYPADVSIHGTPGNDNLVGTDAAEDIYAYGGDDVIDGRAGSDTLVGGPGNDLYIMEGANDRIIENANEGTDEVRTNSKDYVLAANVEKLTGTGSTGQYLSGNNLANIILGGTGNDILNGGIGNDRLDGGAGTDQLFGDHGDDVFVVDPDDIAIDSYAIEYGQANANGYDTVLARGSYTLPDNSYIEVLAPLDPLSTDPVNFRGNSLHQVIYGNNGRNILIGGLEGHGDHLHGSGGDDTYYVGRKDLVFEGAGKGYDSVFVVPDSSLVSYVLPAGSEIEVLSTADSLATYAMDLTGNEFHSLIYGNNGRNVLTSGGGGDHIHGGGGDDTYVVSAGDQVFEGAGNGYDTVLASASFVLKAGSHVEVLATANSAATDAINLTGNELHSLIYGNNGRNILTSGGGGDHLHGEGGDDTYFVGAGDLVFERAGNGYDTVLASASFVLRAGSHVEVLGTANSASMEAINLTGNEFHSLIYGNNGRNSLTSGGGGDHLHGEGGDDTYFVSAGDLVFERAGNGYDTVLASASFVLRAGSHVEVLATANSAATEAINLTGNEFHSLIYGNNGANTLTGGGGGDHLHGEGGNDILVEGAGTDVLVGGAGSDTFLFQNLGTDSILDFLSGTDKIDLSLIDSSSLAAGNNSFTFIGGNAFSGKGGELRVQMDGTTVNILGDVDGDGVADLHIVAHNTTQLTASDFVL